MTSGKLMQWLVSPGSEVKRGDIVAVVETQKGAIDIEIFQDGTVEQLLVTEGEEVAVGAPLALLTGGAAPAAAKTPAPASTPPLVVIEAPPRSAMAAGANGHPHRRVHASPLARRRAEELAVDLAQVAGTRPGGAICASDVVHAKAAMPGLETPLVEPPKVVLPEAAPVVVAPVAAPAPRVSAASVEPTPATTGADRNRMMRAAIAASMSRANREIPHYYLATEIDMKRALDWLAVENQKRSVADRLIHAALLIKAAALATEKVPEVNGFYREDGFEGSDAVHVGVAISLRQSGLIAPALHDADQLDLDQIMAALRDLIGRARGGHLTAKELSDPTITVTNLGDQGVPAVYGVITPPQVALVGFGKIVERPWAVDGMLTVRPIVTATLAADHRASDGHRGGLYLAEIDRLLQEPEKL
jgi:pyruvate dehydrogenase E2 component (dihydrolipoamide acetyltransferase)